MGVVVPFNKKVEIQEIDEEEYEKLLSLHNDEPPSTSDEYQLRVKNTLTTDEYEDFLLGIMDIEYYDCLEDGLKELVDTYFSYLD